MKRIICLITALLMLGSVCTSCGSNTSSSDDKKVTITIGGWPNENKNPEGYKAAEEKRKAFMEKYPDIVVETDTWGFSVDTFLPKAAANQLPTYFALPFTEIDKVIDAGYVADITDKMNEYDITDKLKDDILDYVTRDGRIYMLPTSYYALGLAANRSVLEEAKMLNDDGTVKYPKTFEELGQMAGEIKKKTGRAGFIMPTMNNVGGWHFMNIAWAYGTEFMAKENDKWVAKFDSDECEKALQFIYDLKWKYDALSDNIFIDNTEGQKMLASGQGAMWISAADNNILRTAVVRNGMDKDDLSIGRMPAGPKGHYSLMSGWVQAIPNSATAEQIDAVFKWIDYVGDGGKMTEESKTALDNNFKSLLEEGLPIFKETPFTVWKDGEIVDYTNELREKYGNLDSRYYNEYYDFSDITMKPEEPVSCQELYSILDECIQEVITNKNADVRGLLKDAANKFQLNYLDNAR